MLEINDYITIGTGAEFDYRNYTHMTLYQVTKQINEYQYSTFHTTAIQLVSEPEEPFYFEVELVDNFRCYNDLAYEWPHSEVIDLGDCVYKLV